MSTTYDGHHPPVFPASITIPDDSAKPNASAFNPAIQGLADGMYFLKALCDFNKCVPVIIDCTGATTAFTPPANALPFIFFYGWGGGGAGGRGSLGAGTTPDVFAAGGAGGGGAVSKSGIAPITPGEAHTITVGAGGNGVDGIYGFGLPGEDTTIVRDSDAHVVVRLLGAGGGGAPALETVTNLNTATWSLFKNVRGGSPTKMLATIGGVRADVVFAQRATSGPSPGTTVIIAAAHSDPMERLDTTPQAGGIGVISVWPFSTPIHEQGIEGCPGNPSPEGFQGGDGGTTGTHAIYSGWSDGVYAGGGPGGGGGAGPGGPGGRGGDGGNASNTGVAGHGGDGDSAADNTGGGGGGSGAAGTGTASGAHAGSPGWGGSGRIFVAYFIPMEEAP